MPNQTFFNLPNEKQERIMQAIIKEMGEHTYEHINLSSIIKNAKIPRGSFYQYFNDKSDMYQYFYTYIAKKKFAYWGNLLNFEVDMPFLDRFHMIYMKGIEFTLDYPELVPVGKKILNSDFLTNSEAAKNSMHMATNLYIKYIDIDKQRGRIRNDIDSRFLATLLLEMMNKISLESYLEDQIDKKSIEHNVKKLIDILKKGIE